MKRIGLAMFLLFAPVMLFAEGAEEAVSTSMVLVYILCAFLLFLVFAGLFLWKHLMDELATQRYYMKARMTIVRSMGNIYTTAFYINILKDYYLDLGVKSADDEIVRTPGSAKERMDRYAKENAAPEYREELCRFLDLSTLTERTAGQVSLSMDYKDQNGRWNSMNLIVGDKDEEGNILHVFFGVKDIHEERMKEEMDLRQLEEQFSINEGLSSDYDELWLLKTADRSMQLFRSQKPNLIRMVLYENGIDRNYDKVIKKLINTFVLEEDREAIIKAMDYDALLVSVPDDGLYTLNFREDYSGSIHYRQLCIAKATTTYEEDNFVIGVRDITLMVLNERKAKDALARALLEAEAANRAKTAFLSNMSHDIRTPMNAIIGFTELAREHEGDKEKLDDYLEKIQTSSQHLLSLINDVLDMSRIESGKTTLHSNTIDLYALLRDVHSIITPTLRSKGLDYGHSEDFEEAYVLSDGAKLKEILLNILSNAMKFTKSGGHIQVDTHLEDATDGRKLATFVIHDNGVGISEEFLPRIFVPFEREKTSTNSGVKGTGLGMAITKGLVEMMEGTIAVESTLGEGTTFTVSIPFVLSSKELLPKKQEIDASIGFQGRRILLVEDNQLNQEIATVILEDHGFLVDQAEDGEVAVSKIVANGPGYYDLILMDIMMPHMDGYEATAAIRALPDPALSSLPIVAMTANAFEEDRQAAFQHGMNGHVAKPVSIPKLLETLKELL